MGGKAAGTHKVEIGRAVLVSNRHGSNLLVNSLYVAIVHVPEIPLLPAQAWTLPRWMHNRIIRRMSTTIDLSLDRVKKLAGCLPPYTRPTVHVTGTNGKGSVTSIVASILHESGLKVGRFNSPHFLHVRDSILIGQQPVSEEVYRRTRSLVERINEDKSEPTESKTHDAIRASLFEVLTVTALQIFEAEMVDIAVVEVGMGGRLDATNILPEKDVVEVSAMTTVDIDHVKWLGSDIPSIAREKAGIARRNTPFVLGPQNKEEVEPAIRHCISSAGAVLRRGARVQLDKSLPSLQNRYPTVYHPKRAFQRVLYIPNNPTLGVQLELPLLGRHQIDNLSTALGIVECLQESNKFNGRINMESISRGIREVRWPGRLEYILCTPLMDKAFTILADGAHNPASAAALRDHLNSLGIPDTSLSFIVGLSHSPPKIPRDTLEPMLRVGNSVALVSFTPVEDMPWVASVQAQELAPVIRDLVGSIGQIQTFHPIESSTGTCSDNLRSALKWASDHSDLVIVTGSLYLIADLYRLVEMCPDEFRAF